MPLADPALETNILHSLGITIILIGIIIIAVAFALLFLSTVKNGKIKGGGAVIIGPFPIVFGTDKDSVKTMLWLSIALTIILFALFITLHLLYR